MHASITFSHKGDFSKTINFLNNLKAKHYLKVLTECGEEGLKALRSATPVDTGLTAASWNYEVKMGNGSSSVIWTNSNVNNGVSIVLLIQYGHATGTGGYVQGRDFITPAIQPIFDKISQKAQMEVSKS